MAVPVRPSSPLITAPLSARLFVLKAGLLSLRAVTGGHSCLATTTRDAMPLFVLHPLTSRAHHPLVLRSPSDGVFWRDRRGGSSVFCCSLMNSDNRQNKLRGGGKVRKRWGVWVWIRHNDIQCCVCLLPTSCYPSLPLNRRNRPSPQTAFLPLCISMEKLAQHAVISRTKNTGQQMYHMPGCRHSLTRQSSV